MDAHPPEGESAALPVGKPARQAALIFIFVTVMLDVLALGIIVPVLTPLVVGLVGGSAETAAKYIGIFGTAWAAMQFVAGPILGALSDRFGRRPVVLLSNFGSGVDYIAMALAPSLGWLFVGRVVSGFTTGSIPTAYAYLSDVTPPEKRSAAFGAVGAAFGMGFIVGPALGGMLGQWDVRLPFWVSAALCLANGCYGYFVLPESLPLDKRAAFSWRRANPVSALGFLNSHKELFGMAAVIFSFYLAHEVFPSVYVLYVDSRFGFGPRMVGWLMGSAGVCSALVQAVLIKRALPVLGERGAILVGCLCGAAGFALYGLATQPWMFWLAVPLGAMWGLAGPPAQSIMSRRVDPKEQGRLQGALGSLRGISGMMGPGLYTTTFALFAAEGWMGRRGVTVPGAPFLLSASLVIVSLALAWNVIAHQPKDVSPVEADLEVGSGVPSGAIAPGTEENAPGGFTSEVG